jgi:adenine-specific DNA-methyltransferase
MTRLDKRIDFPVPAALASVAFEASNQIALAAAKIVDGILKHYRPRVGELRASAECLRLIRGKGPEAIQNVLRRLPPEWADHAIACIYAALMPHTRRKELGAYFTPPHLVTHLLGRMAEHGADIACDRMRDPAAGGAAFLVPLARRMVAAWRAEGISDCSIVTLLRRRLLGTEIDRGLAAVANALLRRMLADEWGFRVSIVKDLKIVRTANALSRRIAEQPNHEVGNPPYRRLNVAEHVAMHERFADIASGRLNLYAMFMRRALAEVPPGGLVGHVVPASFLGGPEFSAFRRRLLELADVLIVDLIDPRNDVFVDAIQDACFVVLRRREKKAEATERWAQSGVLHADGHFEAASPMRLPADGSPWHLPGPNPQFSATLEDWGYRVSVGYLVPHRQGERMHNRPARGRVPLIWAKAIGQDGSFDHTRGLSAKRSGWVSVPPDAPYLVRRPCVAVQRTSSRGQTRRVVAAAVPTDFIRRYGGIVGENHVLLLVQSHPDAPPPEVLAEALNSRQISEAMDRACGSASIPVCAIQQLRLPAPDRPAPGS